MTPFKLALAVPVLIFSNAVWAAGNGVPALDVATACKAAANSDIGITYDANQCLKSENDARDQLVREWASFSVPDRTRCTATATMGGTASYVELITCLELQREVQREAAAPSAATPATGRRKR